VLLGRVDFAEETHAALRVGASECRENVLRS
jgi:hypothetical protein